MGVTLTDVLLFGKAQSDDVDNATLVIYRRNILRWGAISHAVDVVVHGVSPLSLLDAVADGLKYLKAFGGCETRNVPEGYQELEYIEGHNNAQYINTGIVPTSSMSMYFKGQFVSVDSSTPAQVSFLAGARDVGGQYGFFLQLASANVGLDWFVVNGRWTESHTRANGDVVEMKVSNSLAQIWLNGTSVGTHQYTPNDTTQYPLFLNGLNSVGQPFDTNVNVVNRIYRFTIAGICDMIPAKRLADNAIGMWDKVRKQFYTNAGTGTFTAGNAVTTQSPDRPLDIWCNNGAVKAIRPLEYLESTGTQYIDTGIVPNANTALIVKAQANTVAGGQIAGCRVGVNDNNVSFRYANSGGVVSYFADFTGTSNWATYRAAYATDTPGIVTIEADKARRAVIAEDGTVLAENTTAVTESITTTLSMYMFGINGMPTLYSGKIYSAKIYQSDKLVRDFIPALDANNVPCMFDKVEGKCYYNAGTGQFIAPYLPAEYEQVEYIQGYTGNSSVDPSIKAAYIDTGLVFDTTVNMYYKGGIGGFNTNSVLAFGARPSNAYSGLSSYFSGSDVVSDWGGTDASGRWTLTLALVAGDIFEVSTYNKTMTISKNGVVAGTNTFTGTAVNNLTFYLNSRHDTGGAPSQSSPSIGRLYRFTVAGVCDMIPARKRSNGHIGMYDLVRKQFFESAGEGQFTVGKLPVLPDGYTQLEYLESTGTQYIDTGVIPNQDTSVELDGSIDGYGIFFGVRTAALVDISTIQGTSTGYWAMGYNTSADAFGTKDSNRHVWFKNKNLQYMDGALKNNYTYANFTAMGNAYLFAFNMNGTVGYVINGRVKIYSCKIWATADSVLVRHLIPAKRNSDSVVGLYDIMNDVFLTNQGTGDFEYGSEIPDSRELHYYIDGTVEKAGIHSASNKNLFNGVFEQGGIFQGNRVNANTRIRTPNPFSLSAGTYTVSCDSAYEIWVEINNASGVSWESSKTITVSATDKIMISVRNKIDPSTTPITPDEAVNVQVEAGSIATAYSPYYDGGLATCENLLATQTLKDEQELVAGDVVRNVGIAVLTGQENWTAESTWFKANVFTGNSMDNAIVCSHFERGTITQDNTVARSAGTTVMMLHYSACANVAALKSWLASQYNAGTPVIVLYALETAETETVAGQTLTVSAGNNTAEIMQASIDDLELEVKYTKGS